MSVLLFVAMAAVPSARAPLRLQFAACPDIDQATVTRVVTMELEAGLADEGQAGPITTARAECTEGRVRLTIDDPVTEKATTRTLDLQSQPRDLRSRLLGLAISEAVLASWIELQLTPEPPPSPPDDVASESRRDAANIAERRLLGTVAPPVPWEILAGPLLRRFSTGLLTLGFSGGARHWFDKRPQTGIELEGDASYGEQTTDDVARATATSFSFAAALLMRSTLGDAIVTAGAGWRVGLAYLSAEPATFRSGDSGWRAWTGPFLAADLSLPLSDSLFLRANVEIGYVLLPAHGRIAGTPVIELGGSSLGGLLSLGTKL